MFKKRLTFKQAIRSAARMLLIIALGGGAIVLSIVFGEWVRQETSDPMAGIFAGSFVFLCFSASLGIAIGTYAFIKRERRLRR